MPDINAQEYLLTKQYNNARKLNARIQLHKRFSTNPYGWQRWVFDHFHDAIPAYGQILELGCGPGTLWISNSDRLPTDWQITLSDFSSGMLQEAQQNLHNRVSDHLFTFEVIDAQSIPFEDAHFDAIIANHMLYHVPDRAKALSEIRRVLKPGGHLYAATNGKNHMHELDELGKKAGIIDPSSLPPTLTVASLSFSLENGQAQLSPWFSQVTLHLYENHLQVTEAEPIIAYILSMRIATDFNEETIQHIRDLIEHELATHGTIRITNKTGLFEAGTDLAPTREATT